MRGKAAAGARLIAATVFVLLLTGCSVQPPAAETASIDRVLVLIAERLSYMNDVARNKWNTGAPIEDLPREREIIDGLGREAPRYGLDAAIARDFFRAQIDASKIIQRTRFSEWKAQNQPPFKHPPDLRDSIRPALDALTPRLMQALTDALPALKSPDTAVLIRRRAAELVPLVAADVPAREEAVAPLLRIAKPQ